MKSAVFRLASVLRIRRFQMDGAARELALQQRQLLTAQHLLHSRESKTRRGRARLQAFVRRGVRAGTLQAVVAGTERLAQEAQVARAELGGARRKVGAARGALLEARTRVGSLEGLQERMERAQRAAHLRLEQRELDEIGQRRRGELQ